MAIAQEYLIRQQVPSQAGEAIFLADYRGQDCLLEVWPVPPGWGAADGWGAAVAELLEPWGSLGA